MFFLYKQPISSIYMEQMMDMDWVISSTKMFGLTWAIISCTALKESLMNHLNIHYPIHSTTLTLSTDFTISR